jgi:nitronate monooxygenase
MIGVGSAGSTGLLEREVRHPREAGVGFGIGLIDWVVRRDPTLLEAAIAARPVLVSVSFGDDWSWADRARAAGIVTATQVYDSDQARRAADAGIEVLVARGVEGGGHGQLTIGTLPLLESVLDAVDVPVLAAGGIATGRGVAAVLAAGASGVWLGTAFAACPESLISDPALQALLRASGAETVVTSAFDVALGYPWPSQYPERVLRNDFTDRWTGHEAQLAIDRDAPTALTAAIAAGNAAMIPVDAGQGVGSLTEARSAAHVIEQLCLEASSLLRSWAR